MPSYGGVSNCSRRQPTLPSECLNDVSAPSFASRGPRSRQVMSSHSTRYGNTDSGVDCRLDDVTMPSFGCVNDSSRRPYSLPMECLNDVSAPSFDQCFARRCIFNDEVLPVDEAFSVA